METVPQAVRIDTAIAAAVEALGYQGMLGDQITRRRFRLPARMRGLGLRSRADLAAAAFAACFAESAECFLHDASGQGGFFAMLAPLFGTRADQLTRFLSLHQLQISATAAAFSDAWQSMQQEVAGQGVSGHGTHSAHTCLPV